MKNSRIFEILLLFYLYFFEFTRFIHTFANISLKKSRFALFSKKRLLFNRFWFWLKSFWNFISYWNERDFTTFSNYVTWNEVKSYFISSWNKRKPHFISFHTIILINIVWIKQRTSAKSLRLSCLSHLFSFRKLLTIDVLLESFQFIELFNLIFFISSDCIVIWHTIRDHMSSLRSRSWSWSCCLCFALILRVFFSLTFSASFRFLFFLCLFVILIIIDSFLLIRWFYWLIDSFIRRCDIEYVDFIQIYLLVFTYRKTL